MGWVPGLPPGATASYRADRWRSGATGSGVHRLATACSVLPGAAMSALSTLSRWVTRTQQPCVNPFSALEVQLALSRVERLIDDLQRDDRRFARAHHLYSAIAAYDRLLDEACRLAGAPIPDAVGDTRRLLAEVELRARGWTW